MNPLRRLVAATLLTGALVVATASNATAATVVSYPDFTSVAGLTLTGSADQVGNLVG